ncbi:MAG: potassium channel protein [Campylobacterales bacterium]|nr:potassium channel protein [Campylobacterales bacterium]
MESLSSWIVIKRLRWPFLVIIISYAISIVGMVLIPGQDNEGHVYHLNFFDAFYFISYTASTIGFGETPYTFTYPQRLWVSFCIYLTVIGWFYGIGSIVALIQDEVLHKELARARFAKAVRGIKEPFILIFGYNNVTKPLIQKLNAIGRRMVVLDKDPQIIEELILENYYPTIPAYSGNVLDPNILEIAGIRKASCQAAVILFEKDEKNTKLALMCKYFNQDLKLIVRSSSIQNYDFLESIGVDHIENPFKVISNRLHLSLTTPHIWLLEMWTQGHPLRIGKREILPHGHYIIYGKGRMGRALERGLKEAGVEYTFIDARMACDETSSNIMLCKEEKIEEKLLAAGIKNAAVIIAGTRDDMVNLAVVTLAKKYNPDVYVISRENEIADIQMFNAANIDRRYVLEAIIVRKTYLHIAMPLVNTFVEHLNRQNEEWGKELVERIISKMGLNPLLHEMTIDHTEAFAVVKEIEKGTSVTLEILQRRREDYRHKNQLIFLMVQRGEETILLPSDDFQIAVGDRVLVVCNEESREDLEYILENYYELKYVMGEGEKTFSFFGFLKS